MTPPKPQSEGPIKGKLEVREVEDWYENKEFALIDEDGAGILYRDSSASEMEQIARRFNAYPRLVAALSEARNWASEEVIMPNSMVSRWDELLAELDAAQEEQSRD